MPRRHAFLNRLWGKIGVLLREETSPKLYEFSQISPHAPVSPLEGEMSAQADRGGYKACVTNTGFRLSLRGRYMPHQTVSKQLRSNAKRLRSQMTDAEKKLWQVIRAHRLEGISFRRQMPIEGVIVDFAAPAHRLIVELDGSQHAELQSQARDIARDRKLQALGWTTLRFWNAEVTHDLDGVCRKILNACGRENF